MDLKPLMDLQEEQIKLFLNNEEIEKTRNTNDLLRLKAEYEKQKAKHDEYNNALKINLAKQELKKNELADIITNISSLEKIKYSKDINTMKKLESIEKELNELNIRKNAVEEKMIMMLEEGENIEKELLELKKKLAFLKRKYNNLKESRESRLQMLQNENEKLQNKINELKSNIDIGIMELYEKVRKKHIDPIATVTHRICSGCKIEIGAMDYESVKAQNEIIRCQNCGRILMYIE